MTESVSGVYDLTYPSPIALKEISSIVVVVELWRKEICAQLESERFQELDLKDEIQLKDVLPGLPSTIYSSLEEYVDTFRKSILSWQKYHHDHVFNVSGSSNILSRFDDFSYDWNGTIHYVRTAKRMMMCDRLTEGEKFKIACVYCFEDDIKRIWPSVSETKELTEIDFQTRPQQYYWICCLRNELHKIPITHNEPIDKFMISRIYMRKLENRSSIMYYWNRLPSDSLTPVDIYLTFKSAPFFARFILPKLNEHQLDIFVAAQGVHLMCSLFYCKSTLVDVLPPWMYIRSRIDISNFSLLIDELLIAEASFVLCDYFRSGWVCLLDEIWKSAPQHFKRLALDDALSNDRLFPYRNALETRNSIGIKFLITVLQDAAFEERNAFWHKNWRNLIMCAPVEDLVVMMKLSFRNENEIMLFKENFTSMYENIEKGCASLLAFGMLKELNDFLSFCCPDELRRMDLKRRLLRLKLLGENSVFSFELVVKNKLLNEFIDDAFQDAVDLGVEFRNQLTSCPETQHCLLKCILHGMYVYVMEFVDTFFPDDEQVMLPLKKRLFEHFKKHLIDGNMYAMYIHGDKLDAFLLWLLGIEDEVHKFKQSIPVEGIFRCAMRTAQLMRSGRNRRNNFKLEFPVSLDNFLMWYFNKDEEEIEKYTMLFHDELKSFRPRKRRRIIY